MDCRRCGKVQVERVPWAEGKQRSTKALRWFLASWAKRLWWQETAQVFGVWWERVWRAVGMAVEWGRERVQLDGVSRIGVDAIAWQKGPAILNSALLGVFATAEPGMRDQFLGSNSKFGVLGDSRPPKGPE